MGSFFGDESNKNMKNNNNNSSITTNSSSKKGKNKSISSSNNSQNNSNNNSSEKPKQPQRGLGVAQLEKIRLHTQMANCGLIPHHHPFLNPSFQHVPEEMRYQLGYHQGVPPPPPPYCYSSPSVPPSAYGYHHPNAFMMGMGDPMERTGNIRYSESQSCNTARWNPNNNIRVMRESQPYTQQQGMITRHLLSHVEQQNGRNNSIESLDSGSQNSESSENEELDLELKL